MLLRPAREDLPVRRAARNGRAPGSLLRFMTDNHSDSRRRVTLGTSDLSVFPLSFGGNVFGWTADEAQSFAVLDAYAAAGGDFVDTADVYSAWVPGNRGGGVGAIIGNWLRSRGNRDSIVVATKVGAHPEAKGLKAANIRTTVENSLNRLGIERIDLLYTHFDDLDTPVSEIVGTLDALVKEGKVREIAASNISAERLSASLEFSDREGLAKYVAIQPRYNLVSRDSYEGELAAVAAEHRLSALPYSALASGFLTGKYRPGGPAVQSARARAPAATWRSRAVRACSTRWTPSRRRGSSSPAWRWPGWPRSRRSPRRSPAPAPSSSCPRCWSAQRCS